MKPGGVLLQMLPYGFTLNETTQKRIRGNIFVDIAMSLNGTYLQWENHEPENAFFVEPFWEDARKNWNPEHGEQVSSGLTPQMMFDRAWRSLLSPMFQAVFCLVVWQCAVMKSCVK